VEQVLAFGTAVVFESYSSSYISSTFDTLSNKVVIVYRDEGNLDYGTAIVGTVSGTSISFGTAVVFESASSVTYQQHLIAQTIKLLLLIEMLIILALVQAQYSN
jgi:hypothetical protein